MVCRALYRFEALDCPCGGLYSRVSVYISVNVISVISYMYKVGLSVFDTFLACPPFHVNLGLHWNLLGPRARCAATRMPCTLMAVLTLLDSFAFLRP